MRKSIFCLADNYTNHAKALPINRYSDKFALMRCYLRYFNYQKSGV